MVHNANGDLKPHGFSVIVTFPIKQLD